MRKLLISGFLGAIFVASSLPAFGQNTNIAVGPSVLQGSVKRLGMNLGDRTYYDAGQITKNLVMRNPGFEGEIYQSTIRCLAGTGTTCLDDDAYSAWPGGYWNGATYEVFYGASQGRTGTISNYTAASGGSGGTFSFSQSGVAPATGDYMIVRMTVPGNAAAGWWPTTSGKGAITTNTSDLPPGTPGKQTASVSAPASGDSASLVSYFDSDAGRSFVLLNGTYQLSFKAKGIGGANAIALSLERLSLHTYLNQTVTLTNAWATYTYTFTAAESGSSLSAVAVRFNTVGQDSFLLDDVSLTQTNSDPSNLTTFTDPVVATLQSLAPGSLRYWGGQLGDTLDNLIAPQFGRQRAGYLAWYTEQDDISYGLHEFLQLCQTLGTEPWFVVPSTFSTSDASNLIEYLAGSAATPYGAKRAARGQASPWTSSFSRIHLEFGNEAWNGAFKGGTIEYSAPYGQRAQAIFGAMRANGAYVPAAFDLVLGGQAVWIGRNQDIQNNCNNNDSFAVAPYMMNTVDSFANNEDLFGSTFAEAEAYVVAGGTAEGVTGGLMTLNQQALQTSSHPVPLIMYEMNLSTLSGSITQTALNSYVSSLGAGLAVADAMLQEMAHGVLTQNLWNLSQYNFALPNGNTANLWGAVIDMGVTNQRRPQYLALQMANQAIGANASMLQTVHTGANPTWNQGLVNTVQLANAHYLQSFAFSSGSGYSLVVFNLHRTAGLPVTFSGPNAPSGTVRATLLTSANITDTNEKAEVISPVASTRTNFDPTAAFSLPPYSMTVLTWTGGQSTAPPPTTPVTGPPLITNVSVSGVTATSATVTWTTDQTATSQVSYGITPAYGTLSASSSSLATAHSTTLSGLTAGTTYDYAAISVNATGQSSTSANFTFTTVAAPTAPAGPVVTPGISRIGGAHGNTGTNSDPASLSLSYSSARGNTLVAVCALGNIGSSISSISDAGSSWTVRAVSSNGTAVRTEIWSTDAGGSAASSAFTINLSATSPASCALEEYSGVGSIGITASGQGTSGMWSGGLKTQDPNNYVVVGLGANSYYGYTAIAGTISQLGGVTANPGNNYTEIGLCDNTATTATAVVCTSVSSSVAWAAAALELRSVKAAASTPVITAVGAGNISPTTAIITWTTDQASSSQTAYGTTPAYGTLSAYAAALVTSHSVSLTALTPGTTYDYAAISGNAAGTTTSANFTFTTPLSALTISNVSVTNITTNTATVNWTTDQASTSQVQFGTSSASALSPFSSALSTSHSVNLTGLTSGVVYNFEAFSVNSAGTQATSPIGAFTTASGSTPPPVPGNVSFWGVTANSVTIAWSTDQASNTGVVYGTTTALGQISSVQPALVQSHGITLTGLTPGVVYYFRAASTNAAGATGYSPTYTFTTIDNVPPVISNITVTPGKGNTASVSWSLSKPAVSQVEYGQTTSYGFWSGSSPLTQTPALNLGWVPSGTIHYRIHSADSHGNQAVSADFTFIEP